MAAEIVVIFDFDKTIIDLDSDNWVIDELGFTDLFNQLLHSMPWNSMMVKFSFSFLQLFLEFLEYFRYGLANFNVVCNF